MSDAKFEVGVEAGVLRCLDCGYDLSGTVATWVERCPLTGVCSECGAGVAWGEIFDPRLLGPRWSVEHGRRLSALRGAKTSVVSLVPRVLWRGLKRDDEVKLGRLAAVLGVWLLVIHGAAVVAAELWAANLSRTPPRFIDGVPLWVWPWRASFMAPTQVPNQERVIDLSLPLIGVWLPTALTAVWVVVFAAWRSVRKARGVDGLWRDRRVPPRHGTRAVLLSLIFAAALTPLYAAGAFWLMVLDARLSADPWERPMWLQVVLICAIAWMLVALCGWWRQAFEMYLGFRRPGGAALGLFGLVVVSFAAALIVLERFGVSL